MPSTEPTAPADLDRLAVDTVRTLAMDAVEAAQSGHPGTPMALAPLGYVLFTRHLTHDPASPLWPDRDRFVLSAGHASMLHYALLHLTGYDLSHAELANFRQLGSMTPGHPEVHHTPGVETTTGPLGQGIATAVGMALAEQLLAARFNREGHEVVDHRTVVIASDGDLMEGVSAEASSLAGHLGLGKLVVFYDDNGITIDGSTELSFTTEDVPARYAAYGWRVLSVDDANDLDELDRVAKEALTSDGRPTLVCVPSVIGYGAPNKAGTASAHGSPLGADEIAAAKAHYGWTATEPLFVPPEAKAHADCTEPGAAAHRVWSERMDAYREAHPDLATDYDRVLSGDLPEGWDHGLPVFETGDTLATRKSSSQVINAIAASVPELVGGSGDLAGSNLTTITDGGDVAAGSFTTRNIHYGIREHAMAAAMNGMAIHGGVRPFGGTFLIFTDYLRPALRLSAIMGVPVVYVMTHDSIGLGEDGPTHQPIEHLAALRAIPNLHVVRPADAREVVGAWQHAIRRTDGPTLLALSRQGLPTLAHTSPDRVAEGAYAVVEVADPDVVLVATGSEVSTCVDAAGTLEAQGIAARVVSLPCWELAGDDARQAVRGPGVPVLSVEAATTFGWSAWADAHVGIDTFGASAPAGELFAHFGITPEAVAQAATDLLRQTT